MTALMRCGMYGLRVGVMLVAKRVLELKEWQWLAMRAMTKARNPSGP